MKMRKELRRKLEEDNYDEESDGSKEEDKEDKKEGEEEEGEEKEVIGYKKEKITKEHQLSKEQSFQIWDATLKDVPTDYDFVITSQQET